MTPLGPDPYKTLGVSKDAQIAEIRSAHRKLVLKCHPDKVQDPELKAQAQDQFQRVQQAYEILSDEKERQRYDDSVQLAELRKQMQNKANISVSRASPSKYAEFEIRTAEPASYKSSQSHSSPKVYHATTFSRSWEDNERRSSSRYHDGAEPARSSRREATYSDRPSKREVEKEREREREREKDRERRKREKEEDRKRREKDEIKAKEKLEKKAREKTRSKEMKRESERRREPESPYIETYPEEDYPSKSEKKKSSSSRKHEEKRERSSHREDVPRYGSEEPTKMDNARAYIQQSLRSNPAQASHLRGMPAVPTPPPAESASFPPPEREEQIRRSAARPRPGSGDIPDLGRERSAYQRPSREYLDRDRDEPVILSASPTSRHPFSSKAHPEMGTSPPHGVHVHRANTMSAAASSTARPIPVGRSNTFNGVYEVGEGTANKGRHRSRKYGQVPEPEYDDDYERRHSDKDRKHRSSKKHRSPERGTETRYHVESGRAKYHSSSSYSRKLSPDGDRETFYYPTSGSARVPESRPAMATWDSGYSGSSFKVKQSKNYDAADVRFSEYPSYREGYSAAA